MRIDPDACRDPVLLAAEVRRLQAVIAASETLTDEEREAIRGAMVCVKQIGPAHLLSTLRGLLERTK
jgi:hypothetical protein